MTSSMTTTEARAALHELLERVEKGDEVTITRHGRPVAVVVRPDSLRSRRADRIYTAAAQLRDQLDGGRSVPMREAVTLDPGRADEMVAEIRAGRDAR